MWNQKNCTKVEQPRPYYDKKIQMKLVHSNDMIRIQSFAIEYPYINF